MEVVSFNDDKPKMRMLSPKILVKPETPKERVERGIIIPISSNSQLEEATVTLVCEDVLPYLRAGDKVLYPKGSGIDQDYDGIKYKFLNGPTATSFGDVWAIVQ